MAVDGVLGQEDEAAPGVVVAADLVVGFGAARLHPGGRREAHGLVEHLRGVGEGGVALQREAPVGHHDIELGAEAGGRFGVGGEVVEGPGERVGGGLVAGEQHGEHLVAELLVAHALPLLVAGGHEEAEEVVVLHGVGAAAGDDVVHERVERAAGLAVAEGGGEGEVLPERVGDGGEETAEEAGERGADGVGLAADVEREERLAGDLEGELVHGLGHVHHLAALGRTLPGRRDGLRGSLHRVREAAEPPMLEGGLGDSPLALPERALGGEQAVAEELPEHLVAARALGVEGQAFHQNAVHRLRLVHHGDHAGAHPHAHHIADRAALLEEGEGIIAETEEVAEQVAAGEHRGQGRGAKEGGGGGVHGDLECERMLSYICERALTSQLAFGSILECTKPLS